MSAYETLLVSRADGVARIVLNRPEVRNALSRTLIGELGAALWPPARRTRTRA